MAILARRPIWVPMSAVRSHHTMVPGHDEQMAAPAVVCAYGPWPRRRAGTWSMPHAVPRVAYRPRRVPAHEQRHVSHHHGYRPPGPADTIRRVEEGARTGLVSGGRGRDHAVPPFAEPVRALRDRDARAGLG